MQKPPTNKTLSPDQRWERQKEKLKKIYPMLVNDDLRYDYGMKEVMLTRLQLKLGKSREGLNSLLKEL